MERDRCPECGSPEVTHIVYGMAAGSPELPELPSWMAMGGVCVDVHNRDRRCDDCGHFWASHEPEPFLPV